MISDNRYRLPHAGDLENQSGIDVFYLAPRPIPTGVAALSSRNLLVHSDEINLDFAIGTATVEFGARGGIGSVVSMIIFFIGVGLSLGVADYVRYGSPIFEVIENLVLPNWYLWAFVSFLTLMYSYYFLNMIRQLYISPPIRFNRQRREVAYVPKRGQPPRFIPWEEVIACVTSGKVVTQYGVQNSFSLMIGLRDSEIGDVVWLTVPTGTLMLAISEWEAIRGYMEEGLSALPRPVSEEFEEGTVAYFHYCREVYRDNHWYVTYLLGFVLIQFCSGWTLPCHIAAWVERLPKTSFPKSVLDWSKPLPPDEWKQPSDELIEQSKAVRKSFRNGKSLLDHFRAQGTTQAELDKTT